MPSYIELDKQASFPASSNSGKVILGINNSNQLQATNSSGQSIGVTGLPYQVYTALLTQSGGDDPLSIDSGLLTIGVTYMINNPSVESDFTNVGAPNNDSGTYFVATGTTPNGWGTDTSILLYNNGAPVVTVLENTIGNIWFTFNSDGQYAVNSNGLFTTNKTFVIIGSAAESALNFAYVTVVPSTDSMMTIDSVNTSALAPLNDELFNTSFEIRIYN
jgi:hypothetical protein